MGTLMKCGCNTHAVIAATGEPYCLIHNVSEVAESLPDLTGRMMRCSYDNGRPGQKVNHEPRPSDHSAAFFQHRPDKATDQFYCGCWGWD